MGVDSGNHNYPLSLNRIENRAKDRYKKAKKVQFIYKLLNITSKLGLAERERQKDRKTERQKDRKTKKTKKTKNSFNFIVLVVEHHGHLLIKYAKSAKSN